MAISRDIEPQRGMTLATVTARRFSPRERSPLAAGPRLGRDGEHGDDDDAAIIV